jgi:hypothetical protein
MRMDYKEYTILNAKGEVGTGLAIPCKDARHILLSFATSGNANLTVKFQGAISDVSGAAPDFSAAQSVSNMWDYVEVIDLQSGTAIAGDTGVSVSGSDDFRLFEVNTDALAYICATVTARTAGAVTVKCLLVGRS